LNFVGVQRENLRAATAPGKPAAPPSATPASIASLCPIESRHLSAYPAIPLIFHCHLLANVS